MTEGEALWSLEVRDWPVWGEIVVKCPAGRHAEPGQTSFNLVARGRDGTVYDVPQAVCVSAGPGGSEWRIVGEFTSRPRPTEIIIE